MATVPANSANEDGESSDLQKYVTLCAECESTAVQIHPSYKKQYVDGRRGLHCEHATRQWAAIVNFPIKTQYFFMRKKKKDFESNASKDSTNPQKTGSCLQANHLMMTFFSKHSNRNKAGRVQQAASHGATLHRSMSPKKRKNEGAKEHLWADNERILTNELQGLELEQLKQAVSDTMQDVVTLPVT